METSWECGLSEAELWKPEKERHGSSNRIISLYLSEPSSLHQSYWRSSTCEEYSGWFSSVTEVRNVQVTTPDSEYDGKWTAGSVHSFCPSWRSTAEIYLFSANHWWICTPRVSAGFYGHFWNHGEAPDHHPKFQNREDRTQNEYDWKETRFPVSTRFPRSLWMQCTVTSRDFRRGNHTIHVRNPWIWDIWSLR